MFLTKLYCIQCQKITEHDGLTCLECIPTFIYTTDGTNIPSPKFMVDNIDSNFVDNC